MKPLRSGNLPALLASLLMFALLCGIAAYWTLQLTGRQAAVAPPEIMSDPRAGIDLVAAGDLFGRAPTAAGNAPPPEVSNIQVVGIAADPSRGAAILAIDGKPGKAFLVGDSLLSGTTLKAVRPDAVVIERAGASIELPVPERPSIALLSSGPNAAAAGGASGPATAATGTPAGGNSRLPTKQPPALPSGATMRPPPSGSAAAAAAGQVNPPPSNPSGMAPITSVPPLDVSRMPGPPSASPAGPPPASSAMQQPADAGAAGTPRPGTAQ